MTSADVGPATEGITEFDVVYLQHDLPDRTRVDLSARIYLPDGPGPFPAVVNVHGGAWTSGDRLNNEATSRELAERGVVVFAIDFRMPPVAAYPEPVADINFAVRWVKANAIRYRTAPDRIGGLGFSSGAHQLLLNAFRPADPRYMRYPLPPGSTATDARVGFLILVYGVLDPDARYESVVERGVQKLVDAHHAYWPDRESMVAASPRLMLLRGEVSDLPPALVIQGEIDDNLTPDMPERFAEAYQHAGGHVEVLRFRDAPHGFFKRDFYGAATRAATDRLIDFIQRQGIESY